MSEILEIQGGTALRGTVQIGGAKNAALPILIASLLSAESCVIENVPNLEDVGILLHLLEQLGAEAKFQNGRVTIQTPRLIASETSYSLVKALRASFWVLAPLLARGGAARVALPGGDLIGARPVDMHLAALEQMGAEIKLKHGVVLATAPHGLKAAEIDFRFASVGATHQVIMAACLTPGTTVIRNAAREPEVVALAEFINSMGADVEGAGTSQIVIRGKRDLAAGKTVLIGDRIEAATYLLAAAGTGGSVRANGIRPEFFGEFLDLLGQLGVELESGPEWLELRAPNRLRAVHAVSGPFPQFATDIQALLMAAVCCSDGTSRIEENVFEGRFGHVSELCRMGAQISVEDRVASVKGVVHLSAAPVEAHDIRAGAALVIAALMAEGVSQLLEPQHLRRGYENLEQKFRALGAKIGRKIQDPEDFAFSGC